MPCAFCWCNPCGLLRLVSPNVCYDTYSYIVSIPVLSPLDYQRFQIGDGEPLQRFLRHLQVLYQYPHVQCGFQGTKEFVVRFLMMPLQLHWLAGLLLIHIWELLQPIRSMSARNLQSVYKVFLCPQSFHWLCCNSRPAHPPISAKEYAVLG